MAHPSQGQPDRIEDLNKKHPKKQPKIQKTQLDSRSVFELVETRSLVQGFTRSGIPWLNTSKRSPQGRRKLEGGVDFL